MRNLIRFIIRFQNFFLFLLLEGIAFILIFNNNPYQRSTFLNSGNVVSGFMFDQTKLVSEYFDLKKNNRELSIENAALKNLLFSTAKDTSDLYYLSDSLPQRGYFTIPSRVIKNSIHRRMNYITIDKGEIDGVKKEMGVYSSQGVVGIVRGTTKHYAVVTPILNTQLFISSKIGRSGYFGSLTWDGLDYRYAKLEAIEKHANLSKGDTILTSGYGAVFPEGVTVGYIRDFKTTDDDDFFDITVELAVDFKSLYYVEIIGNTYALEIDSLKVLEEEND